MQIELDWVRFLYGTMFGEGRNSHASVAGATWCCRTKQPESKAPNKSFQLVAGVIDTTHIMNLIAFQIGSTSNQQLTISPLAEEVCDA